MSKLSIDSNGRLPLPRTAVRELGDKPLEPVSASSRHLLLTAAEEAPVVLAGTLGKLAVADLLSFLNMFRQTGVLCFGLSGGRKELFFQKGEIVAAASTFPEETLAGILYELGKADRETLEKARQFAGKRNPLGKILVQQEAITDQDLWSATRYQAETIVFNLFAHEHGGFSFIDSEVEGRQAVRLSMNTQNLIMEGLRRVDERTLYMRRIGSLEAIPVLVKEPAEKGSLPRQHMLKLLREGGQRVKDVLRRSGLGEFDALRQLHQLIEEKLVRIEEPPAVNMEGELGELLSVYNGALTALYRAIAVKHPEFQQEIRHFLRDLPQPFSYVMRDAVLQEDGSISGANILANLAGLEEGDKKKLLADSLNELLYMECLAARRELGTAGSNELIQRVQDISRRVQKLLGRKE